MRTPLPPRSVALPATPAAAAPHPIDSMVDALNERAGRVTDTRLRQLLLRTACVLVDHAIDSKV